MFGIPINDRGTYKPLAKNLITRSHASRIIMMIEYLGCEPR
ncbi:13842_t:CDS:1 [Acaulospora morrowiae]|uniref:13842_t:CDS:1 n=1 Tax=Acaulospora morrowiae TaxID=94023 RepID=A0A9N9HME8_9GLOM|nr:13842_t:CDS:1 [Acaulospora morrowiae]